MLRPAVLMLVPCVGIVACSPGDPLHADAGPTIDTDATSGATTGGSSGGGDASTDDATTPVDAGSTSGIATSGSGDTGDTGDTGDAGACQPFYEAPVGYAVDPEPWALAVADIDGDHHLDIAVATLGHQVAPSDSVHVLFNHGDGSFASAAAFPVGTAPSGIAAADIDGDGHVDLVATSLDGNATVLHNTGDHTFAPGVAYPVGQIPYSPLVVDLDGQNGPDVVVADSQDGTLSVLLNHGDGTFPPRAVHETETTPIALTTADFDGDGHPDVAVVDAVASSVSVLPGVGDGTFGARSTHFVGASCTTLVAADFDGDGRSDLAVARAPGGFMPGTITMLLGNGEAGFSEPQETSLGEFSLPRGLFPADLDGDGSTDLAVADGSAARAGATLLNDGHAHFSATTVYQNGSGATGVAAGDVDGDDVPDLVIADHIEGTVEVLLGRCR